MASISRTFELGQPTRHTRQAVLPQLSSTGKYASQMTDDPKTWRLAVPQANIDLYVELHDQPRALSGAEARMMVELVDAWRAHEHRKHVALEAVLAARRTE
jgi:hypothetical protein